MQSRNPRSNRPRRSGGRYVTTRSGKTLKINRTLGEKWSALRAAKSRRRVERLIGLPKSRLKRLAWRMQPKRLAAYWFSRDGGIMALKIVGVSIVAFFLLTLGIFAFFRKDLPNITDISGGNIGGSISYYDRTGKILLFQDYKAVKRVPVQGNEISQFIKDATVAVEDRDFFKHRGFDIRAIGRAAINDTLRHGSTQGGSTITQQLVKLTRDFNQNRNFIIKVKELILAVELERTYTKNEILTGYLNAAPYGGIDYGVQAAASDYFHKPAKDLTLAEAAMLAVIPKSPSLYSPYNTENFDKKAFLNRYEYVLDSMVQIGKIAKKDAEAAKKVDVLTEVHPQQTKYAGIRSPYFVLAARGELRNKFVPQGPGSENVGGWKVITTLDMNMQKIAEQKIRDNIANVNNYGADEEAVVMEEVKTGQMMALVGGVDFNAKGHGQINYAQWNISPGSSFKPYDYSALIDNSNAAGAGSVLYDSQGAIPGYPCTNKQRPTFSGNSNGANCLWDYDFRFPGPLSLRYALGGSRNIPAVKSMLITGVDKTIGVANSLMNAPGAYRCFNPGVDVNIATKKNEAQCYGASAIGDGAYLHLDQHVNGLASLARMGKSIPSTYILKYYRGTSNKPAYEWKQPKDGDKNVKQVVRPEAAYIVNNMLSDPNASYLPFGYYKWHRYNGWNTAVKTGTTNNGFDGLMMAWNTKYAVGSWVGYHTRNQSLHGAMEYMTTPLTRGVMTAALDASKDKPTNWTEPSGIQHMPGYVVRQHVGIGSVEPSPATEIYPSWYKPKNPGASQSSVIDRVSNKLATNCTPALAKQTVGGNSAANNFSIDIFYGHSANGTNTTASDDVHSCSDNHPAITLTVAGGSNDCNNSCTLTATVSAGTHPLNDPQYPQFPGTVTFYVNGQSVGSRGVSDPADTVSINYKATFNGSATVTARVVDSVLYESSDSVAANFHKPSGGGGTTGSPLTISSPNEGDDLGNGNGAKTITVSWSGGTGPYIVTVTNGSGCTTSSNSCSVTINGPNNSDHTITVTDSGGDSDSVDITR